MLKATKQNIIDAIIVLIEQGYATEKICAEICTKFQFSSRTFYNHFKKAQEQHLSNQQAIKEAKALLDIENAIDDRKRHIADVNERKEILTQIMRGEIPLKKALVVNGEIQEIDVVPDWMDRKNAIAELNKMEGDYAPTKVAQTNTDGKDIEPITTVNIISPIPIDED